MPSTDPGDSSSREPADVDGGTRSNGSNGTGDFDWRDWTLVAAIIVAFFVVPATLLYLPTARSFIQSLGLTIRDAYLVLPLLPAFGLGGLAVWSAMGTRSG